MLSASSTIPFGDIAILSRGHEVIVGLLCAGEQRGVDNSTSSVSLGLNLGSDRLSLYFLPTPLQYSSPAGTIFLPISATASTPTVAWCSYIFSFHICLASFLAGSDEGKGFHDGVCLPPLSTQRTSGVLFCCSSPNENSISLDPPLMTGSPS